MASYEYRQDDRRPPAYQDQIGAPSSSSHHRQRSGIPINAFDSSRAVADEYMYGINKNNETQDNGAGIGAGRNAYMAPDTPSMYTDPYEYASTVAGPTANPKPVTRSAGAANVLGTRPNTNFLDHDPYASHPQQEQLNRSNTMNTLGPADSVSSHHLHARSQDLGTNGTFEEYNDDGYQEYPYRPSRDYHSRNYSHGGDEYAGAMYGASAASLPLKDHAGYMGYADDEDDEKRQRDQYFNGNSKDDWERHHPPSLFANNMQGPSVPRKSVDENGEDRRGLLAKISGDGIRPGWGGSIEEQIERRRRGIGRQRYPILSWMLSVAYVIVFIIELIKAKSATGQAIQTKPSVNPMIGPPFEFLITFGARFVPCMRKVPDVPLTTPLICLKDVAKTSVPTDQTCPLYEICGLPNANSAGQAYRFVTPIFIHAGFIHILFNLLAQLTLGSQIEKIFSSPIFIVVYAAGGIGGNLLGGNFGLVGLPSVGASGAIYACISLELTDLVYNWKYEYRPKVRLIVSIVFTIIGFAIGLLPGLDNFAHIGGFAVGILGGAVLGPSIHETRKHKIITWVVRVIAAGLLVGFFVGLATNFYNSDDPSKACTWCRYLSCLPLFSQCKGNGLNISTTSSKGT